MTSTKKTAATKPNDEDSSDDIDYVPTKKELKKAGVNDQPSQNDDEEKELTGIALIKEKKRLREVDDLFALMNEEDAQGSKRQKTQNDTASTKVLVSNNQVTEQSKPEADQDDLALPSDDYGKKKVKDSATFNAALAAIQAMKQTKAGQVTEQIKFAGQTFSSTRQKTDKDARQDKFTQKSKTGNDALDGLVKQIVDKDKNVNCMQKTRLDWDQHVKHEGIEDQLENNRKDGYLNKKRFLDKVIEHEYESKKVAEKLARK